MGRTFRTKIVGLTHKNKNGTSRQEILRKCSVGESLVLQRDYGNPYDEYAVSVLRKTGEQIGFVPKDVAFRHPAMNDLAPHMDHGGEATAKIVAILGGGCNIEINVIGGPGEKPYQLKEKEARELRDTAKKLHRSDPKEAIRLYRKSIMTLLEVDTLIRETHHFKKQIAELGYDIGTWRKSPLPIERLTALLEKEKKYSGCLEEIIKYESVEDRKGLSQNDLIKIRKRKRKIKKIIEPEKKLDSNVIIKQIKILQNDPNRFHDECLTFHSYDSSANLADHYRAKISHLGLGVSSIMEMEFDKNTFRKKVDEQFKKWDEEWLTYLQQDLAEGVNGHDST
jgi:hypothetical protein